MVESAKRVRPSRRRNLRRSLKAAVAANAPGRRFLVVQAGGIDAHLVTFASFSAAHWLAPYGRTGTQYFYADEVGLEHLQSALKLSAISKGENVVVTLLNDAG